MNTALLLIIAVVSIGGLSAFNPATASLTCSNGAQPRTLEWSSDLNSANGAVWSGLTNTYDLGGGLSTTARLIDSGPLDTPSTLENSGLLAQAAPGNGSTLVWNLDSVTKGTSSSTLMFDFSEPVESFSVVIIDVDAKSSEPTNIGWHDKITGVVEGPGTSVGLEAADPNLVTVQGASAWAADGSGKVANESPSGNVTISATGTITSAGVSYGDGTRSGDAPERHAIGVASITVCQGQGETATTATPVTPAPTTTAPAPVESTTATQAAAESTTATPAPAESTAGTPESTSPNPEAEADDSVSPETTGPATTLGNSATTADTAETPLVNPVEKPGQPVNPGLAISTEASDPVSNGGTSYSFVYSVTATNTDPVPVESVQLFSDLASSLADAKSWKVSNLSTSAGDCVVSDAYDGRTNDELLEPKIDLKSGESCTVEVAVSVEPATNTQRFEASATGSGVDEDNKLIITPAEPARIAVSDSDQTLAFTGTEAEDLAALGALIFLLGAMLIAYRGRFLLGVGNPAASQQTPM